MFVKLLKLSNLLLSAACIILGFYIILWPFTPELELAVAKASSNGIVYKGEYATSAENVNAGDLKPIPVENTLVIPKILVNAAIISSEDKAALDKGLWHRPNSSTPKKGGNTVIAAHRFLYTSGSNTFYHLDKLEIGDDILVYWEGKEFMYKIFEVREVLPTEVSIENNTANSIITLYTCTPLWTADRRLVVKGQLVNQN